MRLIDADELKKEFKDSPIGLAMQKLVDIQPTAYDIDKVTEELEELEDVGGSWTHKHIYAHKVIEIVKQGVKEQNK